jgi:hypothetical protein
VIPRRPRLAARAVGIDKGGLRAAFCLWATFGTIIASIPGWRVNPGVCRLFFHDLPVGPRFHWHNQPFHVPRFDE